MASFTESFGHDGDVARAGSSTRPFDDDGYLGYDPRLPSQRFDSFSNFADNDSVKESADDSSPIFKDPSYGSGGDDVFTSQPIPETPSPPPIYATAGGYSGTSQEFSSFSPGSNGEAFDEGYVASNGSILPPPSEMEPEEGFALREWRRQNAIQLEEKQKREKELLNQIIDEADEYKIEFYRRRKITVETNKGTNREKEKVFLASQEKFHAEADKNYWKAIAELVPHELPTIEKKRGKKDQDKKPSVVVIKGPKPGKPTDLSRMRQILVRLKHNPPPHMKASPPVPAPSKDAKSGPNAAGALPAKAATVATPAEAVAAA